MLRGAQPSDANEMSGLSNALGYPVDPNTLSERIGRLSLRADHFVGVAQSPSGAIVGWIHAAEHEILESGITCEVLGLVVDRDQRNRGIGRQLIARVEQWAEGRGLKQVTVRSNVIRTESHPFYERLGFTRVKTQHAYRKKL